MEPMDVADGAYHIVQVKRRRMNATLRVDNFPERIFVPQGNYGGRCLHCLHHRCQTLALGLNLARSVIAFGPRSNAKCLLEQTSRYDMAQVPLKLQNPECSTDF